jgi:hypothetical protein
MNKIYLLFVFAAALLAAGCENLKDPATQEVSRTQEEMAALGDDASKYDPSGVQSVQAEVGALKDSLAKGDYKAVIAQSPKVNADINTVMDAVTAKKAEVADALAKANETWKRLSSQVPQLIQKIQDRTKTLSKSKHLPKGLSKSAVADAKSGLESLKTGWTDASSAFTSGNVTDAVSKAQAVKDKADETLQSLGVTA